MDNHYANGHRPHRHTNGHAPIDSSPQSLTHRKRPHPSSSRGPYTDPVHELLVLSEVTGRKDDEQGDPTAGDLIVREDGIFKETEQGSYIQESYKRFHVRKDDEEDEEDEKGVTSALLKEQFELRTMTMVIFANVNVLEGGNEGGDVYGYRLGQKGGDCTVISTVDRQDWQRLGSEKAFDLIIQPLQTGYKRLEKVSETDILFRGFVNPDMRIIKRSLKQMRLKCGGQRMGFHYVGAGAPHPMNGSLWFNDGNKGNYFRVGLGHLFYAMKGPSISIFECVNGGAVVEAFEKLLELRENMVRNADDAVIEEMKAKSIIYCASDSCDALPVNSYLPEDMFTSILTNPMKCSLKWAHARSRLDHVSINDVLELPGKDGDITTPLGELYWIYASITDTIAYSSLPTSIYVQLFRNEDVFLCHLSRNFLLADHIMRQNGCRPCSYPRLPNTYNHPLWQTWEMEIQRRIAHIPEWNRLRLRGELYGKRHLELHGNSANHVAMPRHVVYDWGCDEKPRRCLFFEDQLTSFSARLESSFNRNEKPDLMPCVLNALYSEKYRIRALSLLATYAQTGPLAVQHLAMVNCVDLLVRTILDSEDDDYSSSADALFILAKMLCVDRDTPKRAVATIVEKIVPRVVEMYRDGLLVAKEDVDEQGSLDPAYLTSACFVLTEVLKRTKPDSYVDDPIDLDIMTISVFRMRHSNSIVRRWACLCYLELLKKDDGKCMSLFANDMTTVKQAFSMITSDEASDVRTAAVSLVSHVVLTYLRCMRDLFSTQASRSRNGQDPFDENARVAQTPESAQAGSSSAWDKSHVNGDARIISANDKELRDLDDFSQIIVVVVENDASPLVRREVAIWVTKWVELRRLAFVNIANIVRKSKHFGSWNSSNTLLRVWEALKTLSLDPHPLVSAQAQPCVTSIIIQAEQHAHALGGRIRFDLGLADRRPTISKIPSVPSSPSAGRRRRQEAPPLHQLHATIENEDVEKPGSGIDVNPRHSSPASLKSSGIRGSKRGKESPEATVSSNSTQMRSTVSGVDQTGPSSTSTENSQASTSYSPESEGTNTSSSSGLAIEDGIRGIRRSISSLFLSDKSSGSRPPLRASPRRPQPRTIEYTLHANPTISSPAGPRASSYPMRRTNSFPFLVEADGNKLERVPVTNYGKIVGSFKPRQAESSFFEWSCAGISRMPRNLKCPPRKERVDPLREVGYRKYGLEYGLKLLENPFRCMFGNLCSGEGDLEVREADGRADRTLQNATKNFHISVDAGMVTSLAFMPPDMGASGSHLLVVGDSTGSVSVVDVIQKKGLRKVGIPAGKRVPPSPITSVLPLGAFEDNVAKSATGFHRTSPLFVAGAADGRVAVFRAKVVKGSYCVVGSFIASGTLLQRGLVPAVNQYGPFASSSRLGATPLMEGVKRETIKAMQTGRKGLCLNYDDYLEDLVAGGCEGNIVRVWDMCREACSWKGPVVASGAFPTCLATLEGSSSSVVAVGCSDGTITMLDSRMYIPHRSGTSSDNAVAKIPLYIGKQEAPIVSVAWSRYGSDSSHNILAADAGGKVVVWDVRQGESAINNREPLETIEAHKSLLTAMDTRPRSKVVATASWNRSVKIFGSKSQLIANIESVKIGEKWKALEVPSSLAFHPTRSLFAVGTINSTVIIYS